jgi:hypothetical protein
MFRTAECILIVLRWDLERNIALITARRRGPHSFSAPYSRTTPACFSNPVVSIGPGESPSFPPQVCGFELRALRPSLTSISRVLPLFHSISFSRRMHHHIPRIFFFSRFLFPVLRICPFTRNLNSAYKSRKTTRNARKIPWAVVGTMSASYLCNMPLTPVFLSLSFIPPRSYVTRTGHRTISSLPTNTWGIRHRQRYNPSHLRVPWGTYLKLSCDIDLSFPNRNLEGSSKLET